MKNYCIQCGQAIETDNKSPEITCPACGHVTRLSADPTSGSDGPKKSKFRLTGKDVFIGVVSLACLVLLILLFLRPNEPTRQFIFGDMGSTPTTYSQSPASGSTPPANPTTPVEGATAGSSPSLGGPVSAGAGPQPQAPGDGSVNPSGLLQRQVNSVGLSPIDSTNGQPASVPGNAPAVGGGYGVGGPGNGGAQAGPAGTSPASPTTTPGPPGTAASAASGPGVAGPGENGLQSPTGTATTSPTTAPTTASGGPGTAGGAARPANGGAQASAGASPAINPAAGLPANTAPTSQTSSPTSTGQTGANAGTTPTSTTAPPSAGQAAPGGQNNLASTGFPTSTPSSTPSPTPTQPDAPADSGTSPEPVSKQKTEDLLQLAKNDAKPASSDTNANADSSQNPPPLTPTNSPTTTQDTNSSNPFEAQHGTNVVFVLDRSLSMRNNDKSVVARNKMVDTLRDLGTNKTFYIIFFPYKPMPADAPLPATEANIDSMTNWIFSTGHAFGSNPEKAMAKALELKPDTVWLLSDGEFSTNIIKEIRDANESVQATINTVGFYSRDGERVLRRIAEENHGKYRFVPSPDENQGANPATVNDSGTETAQPPKSP